MTTIDQDRPEAQSAPSQRKRMTIFRAGEGVELDHERMPFEGVDASVMAGFGKLIAAGASTGENERTLVLFSEPGETGMSLTYAWFKSGYVLPKHSHNADCLYYVIGGELRMGTQTLGRGDGIFIPADQSYTYDVGLEGVEVLEFRNATRFNINFMKDEDSHWDRMADVVRQKIPDWADERPPSRR